MKKYKKKVLPNRIKIIGGEFKRREIIFDKRAGFNIRPPTSRMRETLFNWLKNYIKKLNVWIVFQGVGG